MRLISFNVNGIRSMIGKIKNGEKKGSSIQNGIRTLVEEQQPDILCFQEIKTQQKSDLISFQNLFPHIYTNVSTIKKGYSGVAMLTKQEPEWVSYGWERASEEKLQEYESNPFMKEGRILTAKFQNYIVITVYTPNAQPELARLSDRLLWEEALRLYLTSLEEEWKVPIVLCGDLNVAYQEIDIHNPKGKSKMPGFSKEEREEMGKLLDMGWTDSFRYLHPETVKYTYWSNYANSRERNVGWRIDYCLVSSSIREHICEADCLNDYMGSDHCPVLIEINL
jgi:exodeoxyribonuclease III